MSRKSAQALSTASAPTVIHRPEPPAALNDRAVDEWYRIVNTLPSDWFSDENAAVLQQHCEHVAEAEALQLMIEKVRAKAMRDDEAYDRYTDLIKMKERLARLVLSSATKMRLTQQSRYTAKSAGTAGRSAGPSKKPWD